MKYINYLIAAILCSFMTSCTSDIAKYPHDWPVTIDVNPNKCIDISGTYFNKAIEAPSNQDLYGHKKYPSLRINLSKLLVSYSPERRGFKDEGKFFVKIETVNNNNLSVAFIDNGTVIYKKVLINNTDFICSSKFLVFEDTISPENMMGITKQFTKIKFGKTNNGSLIASKEKTDIGTIIVVPYTERVVQYYKFIPKHDFYNK